MKTIELDLKKKVFIVDEKDFDYYEIFEEGIYFKLENGDREFIEGQFFIFGKGSELTEEIASELVDEIGDTLTKENLIENFNSISTFIHLIKSKGFYWLENPISRPRNYELWAKYGDYTQYGIVLTEKCLKWQEAEEKTFKNPLIFIKK